MGLYDRYLRMESMLKENIDMNMNARITDAGNENL